jgi:hypothetical protein
MATSTASLPLVEGPKPFATLPDSTAFPLPLAARKRWEGDDGSEELAKVGLFDPSLRDARSPTVGSREYRALPLSGDPDLRRFCLPSVEIPRVICRQFSSRFPSSCLPGSNLLRLEGDKGRDATSSLRVWTEKSSGSSY